MLHYIISKLQCPTFHCVYQVNSDWAVSVCFLLCQIYLPILAVEATMIDKGRDQKELDGELEDL